MRVSIDVKRQSFRSTPKVVNYHHRTANQDGCHVIIYYPANDATLEPLQGTPSPRWSLKTLYHRPELDLALQG